MIELSISPISTSTLQTSQPINWVKYNKILSNDTSDINPTVLKNLNIEKAILNLINTIKFAVESSLYHPTRKKSRNKVLEEILAEIQNENLFHHKWQKSRDPQFKNRQIKLISSNQTRRLGFLLRLTRHQ